MIVDIGHQEPIVPPAIAGRIFCKHLVDLARKGIDVSTRARLLQRSDERSRRVSPGTYI